MKKGNWIPMDKTLVKTLRNINRPFSVVEAMFSITADYDSGKIMPISHYAGIWGWSIGKVRRFLHNNYPLIKKPERKPKKERWRRSGKSWGIKRLSIFHEDKFRCIYCGEKTELPECDHIVPFSRGGSNQTENPATSCQKCNRQKKDKTLDEWLGK